MRLHSQADPSSALQEFTKAIRLAPNVARLRRGYAQALWMAGRMAEARSAWEEILDMLTGLHEDAEVSALQGWCLGYLGRLDEAVIEYGKARQQQVGAVGDRIRPCYCLPDRWR